MVDPAKPSVTYANADDVPEIVSMIKELAFYERALDCVEATEESLRRTLTFAPGDAHGQHTSSGYV